MEQQHKWRRLVGIFVAVFLLGTSGGVAFGYWTAGGDGTGTGTVASLADVTVNQTTVLDPMYPGDAAQTLSGTFDNPNAGAVFVTTVTVSVGAVTKAVGAPAGTCDATDFTITSATATVNTEIPVGNGVGAWTGPTIHFHNKAGSNQDACKNATVTLAYSIP
jgi:hypothetical protein